MPVRPVGSNIPLRAVARAGLSAAMLFWAVSADAQDATHGKAVFMRCSACHTIDAGTPRMGPDLGGVFGRKAGTLPGYSYSPAMKAAKIVWSKKTLDAFLTAPQSVVKGTKMAFPGISDATDRASLIAYLRSLKDAKK